MTSFKDYGKATAPSQAKLNPILHNIKKQETEEFKRPNHPDFMTSAELRAAEWSGMRKNELALCYEIWIVGEVKKSIPFKEATDEALAKAHVEVFHMKMPT